MSTQERIARYICTTICGDYWSYAGDEARTLYMDYAADIIRHSGTGEKYNFVGACLAASVLFNLISFIAIARWLA